MKKSGIASEELYRIRHSLAHVLAEAVQALRPGSRLGFGPPIDQGFYYDFFLSSPLTEEDFPALEKKMRQIIQEHRPFEREEVLAEEALRRIEALGEPYKRAYAEEELIQKQGLQSLSFYRCGSFVDLCEGPHVENTRQLPLQGFQLRSVAGAYWRGDSRNPMMTRLYAWAFASEADLKAAVKAYELAQQRDHRKLGRELEIFVLDEVIGKGLPLWLPNGTVIREELEKLMKELEFQYGYERVATPHLARTELYYQTGHLPYYAPHLFPIMEVKEEGGASESYCLKPMNCPHHHRIYAARPRSYRELPLRLAEYGQVYRFEDSGALAGLLRVRGMCQNDAHIYCTEDQVQKEFLDVLRLHQEVYAVLGIRDYTPRFSTWDPEDPQGREKFFQQPSDWEWAQAQVERALKESGMSYIEGKGEAAFYGPKVDFQLRTVTGREESASTNQLDFGIPQRLGLSYVGSDNQLHRPFLIHRAPLGTHERFVAFLLEHFGGAFPFWLAPIQVRILTVTPSLEGYAERVQKHLRGRWIRAERSASTETLNKQIRLAAQQKIPCVLVLGEREQTDGTVTVRRYGQEKQHTLSLGVFTEWVEQLRAKRSLDLDLA